MDELYIAAKASVGRAIAENLGGPVISVRGSRGPTHLVVGNKVVTWLFGRVLEQFEPEDYDHVFDSPWENSEKNLPIVPTIWKLKVVPGAEEQIAVIADLVKKATVIVHAGDPDREGQLVVDELLQFLGNTAPVRRILPSAIDSASMKKILSDVRDNNDFHGLHLSGLGRKRADWLIGVNMTRACSIANGRSGMRGILSVGRVQTPALTLVVRRDVEIENYKPHAYFEPKAFFEHSKKQYIGKWKPSASQKNLDSKGRLTDMAVAQMLEAACKGKTGRITEYKIDDRNQPAPLPYSLSALQIKASALYKMTAHEVSEICQSLYETHRVITYPRPNCQHLPEEQHAHSPHVLASIGKFDPALGSLVNASNPRIKSTAWDSKKVSASAHHGVIPTDNANYGSLSDSERKIFLLIAKQYLAQFYPDYAYKHTSVLVLCGGYEFKAFAHASVDMGWRKVLDAEIETDETTKDAQVLPLMNKGDEVACRAFKGDKQLSRPPAPYTEGTLIRTMTHVHETVSEPVLKKRLEMAKGIGTEATRGEIIKVLRQRGFLEGEEDTVVSSSVAREFIAVLPRDVTDVSLTALWENALNLVEKGEMTLELFLEGQGKWIRKLTKEILAKSICIALGYKNEVVNEATVKAAQELVGTTCPTCVKGTLRMQQAGKGDSKGHYFLGCTNYPECKHTVNIEGQDSERERGSGTTRKKKIKRDEKETS